MVVLLASVLFWLWRIRKARRRDLQSLDTVAAREKGYQMTDVTPQSDRSFDSSLPLKSNSVAAPPRPDHDAPPLHRHLRAPSKQLQDSHGNPISAFAFPWSRGEREKRASRVPLVEEDTDTRPPTLPVLGFGEAVPLTTNESYRDPADTMPRTPALDRVSQMGPRQSIANTDPGSRYSEGPGPSVVGSVSPSEGRGFTSRDTRTSDFLPSSPAHQTEPAREQAPSRNLFTSPFTDRSGSGVAGAYEEDDVSDIDENERRKSRKDTDAASIVSELSEHGSGSVVPGSRTGTALGSYSRQGVHPR